MENQALYNTARPPQTTSYCAAHPVEVFVLCHGVFACHVNLASQVQALVLRVIQQLHVTLLLLLQQVDLHRPTDGPTRERRAS